MEAARTAQPTCTMNWMIFVAWTRSTWRTDWPLAGTTAPKAAPAPEACVRTVSATRAQEMGCRFGTRFTAFCLKYFFLSFEKMCKKYKKIGRKLRFSRRYRSFRAILSGRRPHRRFRTCARPLRSHGGRSGMNSTHATADLLWQWR
jgi:hypothetical protein